MKTIITKIKWRYSLGIILLLFVHSAFAAYDKTVAKDGSGDYLTVQAAVDAAPTGLTAPYRIFIKNGKYVENVTIPSNKPFLQFVGESVNNTIISFNNANGKAIPGGGGSTYGTANSATVIVNATDFSAMNVTFENTTGDAPQALAINVNNDRCSFKNCRFLGGQDTLLANNNGLRQYYLNCYVDGVVDFIFGNARAVFDHCVIYPKDRKDNLANSYITAANTKDPEPYGFVFRDCQITANTGVTKYVLGRPWQNDTATPDATKSRNQTVFLNTIMGASVSAVGWSTWDAGTNTSLINYGEYNSTNPDGSPLDVSQRVSWSKQLNATQAGVYSDANLFAGWNPTAVFEDGATYTAPLVVSNFVGVKGSTTTLFKWNISWPITGVQYDIYRSTNNGVDFSIINTQTSSTAGVNFNYTATNPAPGQSYQYYIKASKSGYSDYISEVTTITSVSTITVTGTLGAFLQGLGSPSNSQVYTVSAVDLTSDLVITPPVGYEISSNGGANWYTSANPLHLVPVSGAVSGTTISVRLNGSVAGPYNGDISHVSAGATTINQPLTGTLQNSPLVSAKTIVSWPLTADNTSVITTGVSATTPTFTGFVLADGTSTNGQTNVAGYSTAYGQSFGVTTAGGNWQTNATPPGPGNLNRNFYEEFTVTPASLYEMRVDTISFSTSVTQTTGHFAVSYSLDDFVTTTDISAGIAPDGTALVFATNGVFTNKAVVLNKDDFGTLNNTYKFPLSSVAVGVGKTLKVRIYYRTGTSSAGRFASLKNFLVKGATAIAPVSGDYRTVKSGSWTDNTVWEKFDGTNWTAAASGDFPSYASGKTSIIQSGHTVTTVATATVQTLIAGSFGYLNGINIKNGGLLLNPAGVATKLASGFTYTVDGELNNQGDITNNGVINMVVNGTVRNSSANFKVGDASGATLTVNGLFINSSATITFNNVTVSATGTYQQAVNSPNMPASIIFQDGSTYLVTGLTTSQTNVVKSATSYYNIVWDNQNEASYYAFQGNLTSNLRGKFTVKNTGTTYLALMNSSSTISFPEGYEQTGGRVLVRENGTINATLNVGKDFIVTGGTFESNSATTVAMNLTGASNKYNYNDATVKLTNFAANVSGSYTLQSPVVASSVTLSGTGKVILGTNNLTVGAISSGSGTAYVVTNSTGKLKINSVGATNVTFPVGSSITSYSPVILNNAGTADNFSVNVQNTFDNALPTPSKAVTKQWNITEDVVGGSNATVSLGWLTGDQGASFNPANAVSLLHYTGGSWQETAATTSGAGTAGSPYLAVGAGVTSFSPFGVGNVGVLPLNFLSFKATLDKKISPKVSLVWKTTNEVKTTKFDIERSIDGQTFTKIGSVNAKNVSGILNYSTTDENPLSGVSYYRLKQIDLDGVITLSDVQVINNQVDVVLSIYPNPTSQTLNVSYAKAGIGANLSILSLDGKSVSHKNIDVNSVQSKIDVSTLNTGIYFIIYQNNGEQTAVKFLKN